MGLISPGGENLLDFLELRQVLSTYEGDLRDTLWWPQERPDPRELLRSHSGFLSRRCRVLRLCVKSVPEPEDSSPMLTWILGYFWSLPRGVSPRLEWGHARALSSRTVAAMPRFPSGGSRDLWLSLEAFPRGFSTGLSHVPPWCESILLLKVESVQGNRFPWNGLRHLGDSGNSGTTLAFLSPILWRAHPPEMRRERREFFPDHAGKESLVSSLEAETGLLWMWAGLSCFLSSGDGYVGELLELQQGCEGSFGSSKG